MGNNRKENRNRYGKGFEKKIENPDEVQKKQQTPNEEVPNVGDHEKNGPTIDPTRNPSEESADKNNDNEESLGEVLSQGKAQLEEKP